MIKYVGDPVRSDSKRFCQYKNIAETERSVILFVSSGIFANCDSQADEKNKDGRTRCHVLLFCWRKEAATNGVDPTGWKAAIQKGGRVWKSLAD